MRWNLAWNPGLWATSTNAFGTLVCIKINKGLLTRLLPILTLSDSESLTGFKKSAFLTRTQMLLTLQENRFIQPNYCCGYGQIPFLFVCFRILMHFKQEGKSKTDFLNLILTANSIFQKKSYIGFQYKHNKVRASPVKCWRDSRILNQRGSRSLKASSS